MKSALDALALALELVRAIVEAGKDPAVEIPAITGRYREAKKDFDAATERRIKERFR